jgi:3'-5' exonuclease
MLEHVDLQQILILDIETVPVYSSFNDVPENFQKLWEQKTA